MSLRSPARWYTLGTRAAGGQGERRGTAVTIGCEQRQVNAPWGLGAGNTPGRGPEFESLTSRTVRDLVVGSDVALRDRGLQQLKGIEGTWQLFTVVER